MASHNRACSKGANFKTINKPSAIQSIFGIPTKALAKPRAPAPGPDFSASLEAQERFAVAVCIMLVPYSITEAATIYMPRVSWPPQVRAECQHDSRCQQYCMSAEHATQQLLHGASSIIAYLCDECAFV
jgi:hypothetical protein